MTSFRTIVPPLPPRRVSNAYYDAMHDQVFGGPGFPLSKFEYWTNPAYAAMASRDLYYNVAQAAWSEGIVPKTPEGLESLLTWIGEGYPVGVAILGAAAFDPFWNWFQQQITAGTGNPPAVVGGPPPPPPATPRTDAPVGIQLLYIGDVSADSADIEATNPDSFPDAVMGVVGMRTVTPLTNGQRSYGAWVDINPIRGARFLDIGVSDPSQLSTGWYAPLTTVQAGIGSLPMPSRTARLAYASTARVLGDESALLSLAQSLGANVGRPAAWTATVTVIGPGNPPILLPPHGGPSLPPAGVNPNDQSTIDSLLGSPVTPGAGSAAPRPVGGLPALTPAGAGAGGAPSSLIFGLTEKQVTLYGGLLLVGLGIIQFLKPRRRR